ncbi:hypothetical protein OE88DRAFT_1737954 [Heliocybe sulcata]|uniref:DUF202 domain-containing protein n=1 Tax=Heliocybe sulcata TaxID=5364 RepID=A0A5C3MTJ0_9AGAM|nr:hypothetical protein OE88DRAFT_1737954 [Heliocybe sulcata]
MPESVDPVDMAFGISPFGVSRPLSAPPPRLRAASRYHQLFLLLVPLDTLRLSSCSQRDLSYTVGQLKCLIGIDIGPGHRADSFQASDVNELIELRARHRTFDGAYRRTALGNLGYALAVLKLFDRRFYRIGLLYTVLSGLLLVISFMRARHSRHDFADNHMDYVDWAELSNNSDEASRSASRRHYAIVTRGQENKRVYGRPFVTAGWIVLAVAGVVAAVEIGLFVLVLQI